MHTKISNSSSQNCWVFNELPLALDFPLEYHSCDPCRNTHSTFHSSFCLFFPFPPLSSLLPLSTRVVCHPRDASRFVLPTFHELESRREMAFSYFPYVNIRQLCSAIVARGCWLLFWLHFRRRKLVRWSFYTLAIVVAAFSHGLLASSASLDFHQTHFSICIVTSPNSCKTFKVVMSRSIRTKWTSTKCNIKKYMKIKVALRKKSHAKIKPYGN